MFGITNVSVVPTRGSWKGVPEPSFNLYGEGMTFESATQLSKFLGMMFSQDAVATTQPFYAEDGQGGIPAVYIGSPKKLTKGQLNKIVAAATEAGIDYSTTVDGRGVKFLYFGEDSGVEAYFDQVADIGKKAGLPLVEQFTARSELNEASHYDTGTDGQTRSAWLQETAAGPSDLFRRAVDHVLIPYAKAVGSEGYRFSTDRARKERENQELEAQARQEREHRETLERQILEREQAYRRDRLDFSIQPSLRPYCENHPYHPSCDPPY